jgi:hypothetical protein
MAQDKKHEYFFQVDYQHIFAPILDSVVDIDYKPFVEKVNTYNTDVASEWIKNHEKK